MKLKLEAAQRLKASNHDAHRKAFISATEDTEWFDNMSKEQQEDYIEDHPNSKFAKDHAAKEKKFKEDGDVERIAQLKSQIQMLKDDIADMDGEGDDSTRERKQLKDLTLELRSLT